MTTLSECVFLAFDLETTGVDPLTAEPVSYALIGENGYSATGYCKPTIPIPHSATAIHGIHDEHVKFDRSSEQQMLKVGAIIRSSIYSSADWVLTGMNLCYDLTILNRYVPGITDELNIFDVLVIDRMFDKYRRGSRKLTNLCDHYNVALKHAHSADADARACIFIARKQIAWYILGKTSPRVFTMMQAGGHLRWISQYSQWRTENGQDAIPESEWGWPVR